MAHNAIVPKNAHSVFVWGWGGWLQGMECRCEVFCTATACINNELDHGCSKCHTAESKKEALVMTSTCFFLSPFTLLPPTPLLFWHLGKISCNTAEITAYKAQCTWAKIWKDSCMFMCKDNSLTRQENVQMCQGVQLRALSLKVS